MTRSTARRQRLTAHALALTGALTGCTTAISGGPGGKQDDLDDSPVARCSGGGEMFDALRADFAAQLEAEGVPGGSLAIVCGDELLSAGVGVQYEGGPDVSATTRFQLASVTKSLTAATAHILAADGVVDLDAPIGEVLPQLAYGELTLEDLLAHTAGYPTEVTGYAEGLIDWANANKGATMWSPPGAVWNYSNPGYAVAGAAMQVAGERRFATLIEQRLMAPAGMTGATMSIADLGSDVARGHEGSKSDPTVLKPTDSYYGEENYAPMGGAWSSAEDLARFLRLSWGDDALADKIAPMWEPRTPTGEPGVSYGHGVFVDRSFQPTLRYHSGSVGGFLADYLVVPEAEFAAVALINADWYNPNIITSTAFQELLEPEDREVEPTWDDARRARCVGTYQSSVFGEVAVTQRGDDLVAELKDHGYSTTLVPSYGGSFEMEWRGEDTTADLTFWLDDDDDAPAGYIVSLWGVGERTD
jgi:CubicO group peptidase (beta-lactamase class C family)